MNKQIVAAFDFDGTITKRDALVPFLVHLKGWPSTANHLFCALPWLVGFATGCVSRQATKERVLAPFITGRTKEELEQAGRSFAEGPLQKLLRPKALERLHWHQSEGHRCILLSATLDVFLMPWARMEKFDDLICSTLAFDAANRATGKLQGLNCWGHEKTRRLTELLGPKEHYELYAYGDSRGDKELLALADHPFYRRME